MDTTNWQWQDGLRKALGNYPPVTQIAVSSLDLRAKALFSVATTPELQWLDIEASDAYLGLPGIGIANLHIEPLRVRFTEAGLPAPGKLHISADAVNVGIPLRSLTSVLAWQGTELTLENMQANVLGGVVSIDALQDFTSLGSQGTVRIQGLDLSQTLALLKTETLTMTGLADLELPIVLTEQGIEVRKGALLGSPGVLRYSASLGAGDESLDTVNRILNNLHFEELSAEVTYQNPGELILATRIKGYNPDFQDAHPVELNLTVENNLQSVLKSVRTLDSIHQWVERRFDRDHTPSP
jgi:hypothetical protein